MNKKVFLLGMTSILAVGTVAAVAFTYGRDGYPLIGAKATLKEFTLNETVGKNQFAPAKIDDEPTVVSVVTGVSSNLEASVSLPKSSSGQYGYVFGDSTYGCFVRNSETVGSPSFIVDIGVNNPTSVSVTYRMNKTEYTAATEVRCIIAAYKDSSKLDQTASSGDAAINNDYTLTWTRKSEQLESANKIAITVEAFGGGTSVYWGEPLMIKSINLQWEC